MRCVNLKTLKIKSMKAIITIIMTVFFLTPDLVEAKVFKCKNKSGKINYSPKPCDESTQTKLQSKIKAASSNSVQQPNNPSGTWINKKNTKMTAYLSSGGGFQMTDHTGQLMRGSWSKGDKGKLLVDAKFQGLDMGIKMKYLDDKDILLLSKPGFTSTLVEYTRSNK